MEAGDGQDPVRSVDPRRVGQSQDEGDHQDHAEEESHSHPGEMAMVPYKPTNPAKEASSTERSSASSPNSQHRLRDNTKSPVPQPPLLLTEDSRRSQTDASTDPPDTNARREHPSEISTTPRRHADRGTASAEDQKLAGLEAVLIFRMILYAMLLETAVDSSDILAMEEKDRYVYVL